MAEPALKLVEEMPAPIIRRFNSADLSTHGAWILPRMLQTFKHLSERAAASFLQNIEFNNEYLFLYHENGVALAQVMSAHMLDGSNVIHERFVWVKDKEDKNQLKHAANFYTEMMKWAKAQGAEVIIVEENTDVPHDMIKEKLGRIFQRQQQFARV
jgi:hypothetical protein